MSTPVSASEKSEYVTEGSLVSVVVVSAGRGDLLAKCLAGLRSQSHENLECFVYLNRSTADAAHGWSQAYPWVKFDFFSDNELYCKPLNRGIRRSKGDFVLCLNDDVILSPEFIENLLFAMIADSSLGSVAGLLLRADGRTVDSLGFSWTRSRKPADRRYGRELRPSDKRGGDIFGVNGAAAFYRRKMLEDIKLNGEYFDEDYGIYYEDLDVAWRARRAGWKARYCPEAVACHERGATTRIRPHFLKRFALPQMPQELKVRHVRNRYLTMIKNERFPTFLMDLPWILFYEIMLFFYLLFFDRGVLKIIFKDPSFFASAFAKRRQILSSQK